jgi:hypothetical protein
MSPWSTLMPYREKVRKIFKGNFCVCFCNLMVRECLVMGIVMELRKLWGVNFGISGDFFICGFCYDKSIELRWI